MDNLLMYLRWRGDLSFLEKEFNEIDSLIFAILSYVEWEEIVGKEAISLQLACKKYCERYDQGHFNKTYRFSPMISKLVHLLPTMNRYKEVQLTHYQSFKDKKRSVQFAAVCVILPDTFYYFSYRGTDISILGWKEDLDMTYLDVIPSQTLAADYFMTIVKEIFKPKKWWKLKKTNPVLYLGGHSKGGNLAMYAAICNKEWSDYIKGVYSFDGPGFRKNFFLQHDLSFILDRLYHYIPTASIFGRLLEHQQTSIIIQGYSSGLQQHDGFYWQVERDHFIRAEVLGKESDKIKLYLDQILMSKTDEEKKIFIQLLYKMLEEMKVESINDFTAVGFRQWLRGIKELRMMSKEEYKMFYELLKLVFMQSKSFLFDKIIH